MKKIFLFLIWSASIFLFLIFLVSIAEASTLTGTVKNPDGTGVTGRISFRLAQQGAVTNAGTCGGPSVIVPTREVFFTLTGGAFTGSPTVVGNDCILPAKTYYVVTVRDAQNNILFQEHWTVTGTNFDVGTVVPTTTAGTAFSGAVLLDPPFNGDQQISGNLLPNGTRDFGSLTGKWRDGWFSRSVQSGTDFRIGNAGMGGLEALFLDGSTNLAVGDPFTGTGRWDSVEFFPGTSTYQTRMTRGGIQWNVVNTPPSPVAGTGFIYFDGSVFKVIQGSSAAVNLFSTGGPVSGTGTSGTLAAWNGPTSIGDSSFVDDGTEVILNGRHLFSDTDGVSDLGAFNRHWSRVWSRQFLSNFSENMTIGTAQNFGVNFVTNSTARWTMQNAGHFVPLIDNTYDIGSTSFQMRNVYIKTNLNLSTLACPAGLTGPLLVNDQGNVVRGGCS